MRITKTKIKKELDLQKYVNSETGESLLSELEKGASLQVSTETGEFKITSDDFVITEKGALTYINRELHPLDGSRFYQMAGMLKTSFNIIFNYNTPHTLLSLSTALQMSKEETSKLCTRLRRKGLLFSGTVIKSGR